MLPRKLNHLPSKEVLMGANLKLIHLICACLFLGNVIVSGIWALQAERTRNHAIIQFSNRMVLITDVFFTLLGSLGVVWTGHGMAENFGGGDGHPWIQWSYGLLGFSGLIWLLVLVPIQLKQRSLLLNTDTVGEDYWRLSRIWKIAGAFATLLPLPIVYLMVTKGL
jgi:uncharacterized membrane protein